MQVLDNKLHYDYLLRLSFFQGVLRRLSQIAMQFLS